MISLYSHGKYVHLSKLFNSTENRIPGQLLSNNGLCPQNSATKEAYLNIFYLYIISTLLHTFGMPSLCLYIMFFVHVSICMYAAIVVRVLTTVTFVCSL